MDKNHRCCLSCRKIAPKEAFWRIVRCHGDPSELGETNRTVQLDTGMGRSAYLCPTADCLKQAQKKKRIGRSLRTAVPDTIYQTLEQRLTASS